MRIVNLGLTISLLVGNTNAAVAHFPHIHHEVRLAETAQVINDDNTEVPHRGQGRK